MSVLLSSESAINILFASAGVELFNLSPPVPGSALPVAVLKV